VCLLPLVLVVDDEDSILELIAFNLKKEGFQVDTATNGHDALIKIAEKAPDLVVLDWMLPGINGLEVCRKLRDSEETAALPVIMLTARGEEGDKVLGLELGANDYVTKPFSPRELTARIKAHLRARSTQREVQEGREQVVMQRGLVLDPEKYTVKKNGKPLDATPKEFELLYLLISHPGRVFRREDILNRVWGYDYPADTRTVDVHVRYLRQKIEDDANRPSLLLTVRGVGYKFRESGE
jgi:two-component system alkaline phosphatase synthesis response regulator PhoP